MTAMVVKVTLSTGKIVLLHELKIKHQNLACQAVGKKAGDNNLLMATLMQEELIKILLFKINDEVPSAADREDLDKLFTYTEYSQLNKVTNKLMGGDDAGECQTEIVSTGKQ